MKYFLKHIAMACAFVTIGSAAHSATLNLTETTDYDTVLASSTSLGVLGVGTNTISGSIDFDCTPSGAFFSRCGVSVAADTSDVLKLTLASGTRVLSGSRMDVTNASYEGSIDLRLNGSLVAFSFPSSNPNGQVIINELIVPTTGPFDIEFLVGGTLDSFVRDGNHTFDYTITLDVESLGTVPLPASGLMLLGAVGVAGAVGRKKRRS